MELGDYLRALRKRWLVIVLSACVGAAALGALAFTSTPQYRATTKVFLSTERGESVSELVQGSTYTQNLVASFAQVATMPAVLDPVIEELGLDTTAKRLASSITAESPLNTVIIQITAVDTSPQRAADIANAVSAQLASSVGTLSPTGPDGEASLKVTTVAPAAVPSVPFAPNTRRSAAEGLLIGLAVGVAIAVVRELLDTKVRNEDGVRRVTNATVIGAIGMDRDAAKHPLIVQTSPHGQRAEAFRRLRTNLQFVNVGGRPRSIVITSPLAGEGKSTTAVNLAITLAEADSRVLLIDADLRRPSIASYMGLEGAAGLTTVLIGNAAAEDVVQHWGGGTLDVLPAGIVPPNPSELLGSQAMHDLLTKFTEEYDLVLVDSAPLLPVTDAAILARLTDGAVVVVNARKTHRQQLADAIGSLETVGARVLGVVINKLSTKRATSYQSYEPVPGTISPTLTTWARVQYPAPAPPPEPREYFSSVRAEEVPAPVVTPVVRELKPSHAAPRAPEPEPVADSGDKVAVDVVQTAGRREALEHEASGSDLHRSEPRATPSGPANP